MQGARRSGIALRLSLLAGATAALALLAGAPAAGAQTTDAPELPARAWVLVDAADRETLAGERRAGSFPVASTTKLMTAYVASRALELSETVVAPPYAANSAESLLGLVPGERIETRDLLYGLLIASGNDAAIALAEAAAGSEARFVGRMNRAARRLGLDDTSYANPVGLDERGNFSSARDLVDLAIELREDRLFRRILDTAEATLRSGARTRQIVNRNDLVRTVPYVNGVKTGYTLGAGNVLVASGTRKGVTLVSAVLGVPTEAERDAATLELLEYGFSLYQRRTPLRRGEPLAARPVRDQDERLEVAAAGDVRLTVRDGQRLETALDLPAQVEGPIGRGERIGTATVDVDGEPVERVALVATRAVAEASLLERFDGAVPGPRGLAWAVAIGGVGIVLAGAIALRDRLRRRGRGLH